MTDQTPQSSTRSATPSPEGQQSEIGKAFREVEAAENKAVSIENCIHSIRGVSNNLLQKLIGFNSTQTIYCPLIKWL